MIKEKMKQLIGKSINKYNTQHVKDVVSELKFKEQYQGRIIDCMVGEVDDNYIETPETDSSIVKLEHSKEGLIKVHSIKGKTILVDADGNETDTPAEGCRLVSVGEEDNKLIFSSKNKNLFDNSERVNGYYWSGYNTETEHSTSYLSRTYIKVSQETYVTNGNTQVLEYDKDKNFIQRVQVTNHTYTPTENVKYVRLSYYNLGIDFKGQFELGSISTTYVEPKQHKTEILLNEPLRSLPNGVCDEIVGNKLIRRVGKIIFKGNESWRSGGWSNNERVELYGTDLNIINLKNKGSLKCNMFKVLPHSNAINDTYIDCIMCGKYISIFIDANRLVTNDLKGAKLWLSENPIEVLYELAEPIIEELPNSITLQGFDDTTMYIENSITPTVTYGYNALIPYKEEVLNQQQEVETNTLDIEQNIIPYLMDMEFNLMLMEDE